jgi:hypothetical protein
MSGKSWEPTVRLDPNRDPQATMPEAGWQVVYRGREAHSGLESRVMVPGAPRRAT